MFFLTALLIIVNGLENKTFLSTSVLGSQCPSAINSFTVNGFTATPWPPTSGSTVTCTMTGVFTNSATVSSVAYIITNYGTDINENNYPLQKKTYSKNQAATFHFLIQIPALSNQLAWGNYEIDLGLVTDKNIQINCWALTFSIVYGSQ